MGLSGDGHDEGKHIWWRRAKEESDFSAASEINLRSQQLMAQDGARVVTSSHPEQLCSKLCALVYPLASGTDAVKFYACDYGSRGAGVDV